mgnify:CR=1 FL=1
MTKDIRGSLKTTSRGQNKQYDERRKSDKSRLLLNGDLERGMLSGQCYAQNQVSHFFFFSRTHKTNKKIVRRIILCALISTLMVSGLLA